MSRSQFKLISIRSDKSSFGGRQNLGKRKEKRPFIPKKPMHVVLRSSKAQKELSFLRPAHSRKIHEIIHRQARKHFVKLYEYVNVGNHLHLKIKGYSREGFQAFLISTTALIARAVTGAKRGKAFGKFWDALAFTRVIRTKFEEKILSKYFDGNALEVVFGKEVRDIFLGKSTLVLS